MTELVLKTGFMKHWLAGVLVASAALTWLGAASALAQAPGAGAGASGTLTLPERLPEPQGPQVAATEKLVRDLFKEEYARRTAEDRQALARRLIEQAGQSSDDPVARFVCLREARDLAVAAGDAELTMEAIDTLALDYVIDELEMRIKAIPQAAGNAATPALCEAAATAALAIVDAAVAKDQYDKAVKLASTAESAAARTRNAGFIDHVRDQVKAFQALRTEYEPVKGALLRLKSNPEDPGPNGVVGRFFCLRKGDWDRGLPHLAKGNDAALAAAAGRDLANPQDPRLQAETGDGWWDLSEKPGPNRAKLRERAAQWYAKAAPDLTGLNKARIDNRLASLVQDKPLSSKVAIVRAAYGTQRSNMDLTVAIQKLLAADPFLAIEPGPYISGTRRWVWDRRLEAEVAIDGRREIISLRDGQVGTIPAFPREGVAVQGAPEEFTIVAARYGAQASWIDVTTTLRANLRDPTKEFEFKSSLAPRDPIPKVNKHFVIWYDLKGKRYVQILSAGDRRTLAFQ